MSDQPPPPAATCCLCRRPTTDYYREAARFAGVRYTLAVCRGCYEDALRREQRDRFWERLRVQRVVSEGRAA